VTTESPLVVVDASVMVDAMATPGIRGARARRAINGHRLAAPEQLVVEVFHGVRGRLIGGKLSLPFASRAVDRLGQLEVHLVPTALLLERMWALRDNLSGYDAAYVAAAEHLGVPLVTSDKRLAAAPGVRCEVRMP
jgi:predicted nucleic acid-binding protein